MGKPQIHDAGGPKLTQQHMEGSTDINKLAEKYLRTGVIESGRANGLKPTFITITGDTFHEMLIKVQEQQGRFASLPAKIRKRFSNNPENLFRFLEDSKNLREAVALGLVDEADLDPARIEQMNLVAASEAEEKLQFEKWRKWQRDKAAGVADEEANPMPKADEESQPSFQRKKRTP